MFSIATLLTSLLGSDPTYVQKNDIPPRLQWNHNYGYCGETSFICAGLYLGQYCSQYTARSLASGGAPQYSSSSQLLLGVNDTQAADQMSLNYDKWQYETQSSPPQGSTQDFLVWVKHHVASGHPVIIGIFNNEYLIYGKTNPTAGDPEYDHIVPVIGVGSYSTPIDDGNYHGTDELYFTDNGLYPSTSPTFFYQSSFDAFQLTRQEANAKNGPVYSLLVSPDHYAIALLSVYDDDDVTLPVNLKTSVNTELPQIGEGKDTPPTAKPLTLTVLVSGLTSGSAYNLYLYNDFSNVPEKNFNSTPYTQKFAFTASGDTYTMTHAIMSNETAVFRAVPVTAP
jgi:hypothetical protein